LQFTASQRIYEQTGAQVYWNSTLVGYSRVPDSHKSYTQSYVGNDITTGKYGMGIKWDINDIFTFRANYIKEEISQDEHVYARNTIQTKDTFQTMLASTAPTFNNTEAGYAYLDSRFNTGSISHQLTAGYAGTYHHSYRYPDNISAVVINDVTFSNPKVPKPTFNIIGTGKRYNNSILRRDGYKIGDDIRFNEQWEMLVGLSYSRILAENLNATESRTYYYDETKLTPTLSILYKPLPLLTIYATYIEALETGTIVGSSYANSGEIFSPYASKQYELGVKANVHDMFLTAALFRIEKENSYDAPTTPLPTLTKDGLQIHQGLELTATGKLTDRITLVGGITLMDTSVEKTSIPAIKGKRPVNVAEKLIKLYGEYHVPGVPGLYLTGGAYYTGKQYADNINTMSLPSYTIVDVGARYVTSVRGNETIFRLNVMNAADKEYWAQNCAVGEPRTVAFSATMKF
jgi:iron complex outermembrane receptor protein